MEPMTLGSPPSGGRSPATSPYLPCFLMGETQATQQTRNNTLSPNGSAGRNVSFATPQRVTSPQEYTSYNGNRSAIGQKTLFGGGYQQISPAHPSAGVNYSGTGASLQSQNASFSGPPTQGLFDSLHKERYQVETPVRGSGIGAPLTSQYGTPTMQQNITATSPYGGGLNISQSFQQQHLPSHPPATYNETFLSNSTATSFNASRCGGFMSPAQGVASPHTSRCYTGFWITVFGFPTSATATILQHFAQCGTIVDKVFPPQNGNWVHLKFASRLECDKALTYNEKILGGNIMIGVTYCKDPDVVDKENLNEYNPTKGKVRPLAQIAYKTVENDIAVVDSPYAPQKSSGLVNKAMDLLFGW